MITTKVRLSDQDFKSLTDCFGKYFFKQDRLWLFGSRADLTKKGGDIDLYVETHAGTAEEAIKMKLRFLSEFEEKIGEQKIDVVINLLNRPHPLPIHEIAKTKGVRIV